MKLTILKAAIFGVLSLLILGLNEASAATCTIQI